jgi:hypothetical protein
LAFDYFFEISIPSLGGQGEVNKLNIYNFFILHSKKVTKNVISIFFRLSVAGIDPVFFQNPLDSLESIGAPKKQKKLAHICGGAFFIFWNPVTS